ncbi:unnamed protein product [Boreogadus saida]
MVAFPNCGGDSYPTRQWESVFPQCSTFRLGQCEREWPLTELKEFTAISPCSGPAHAPPALAPSPVAVSQFHSPYLGPPEPH